MYSDILVSIIMPVYNVEKYIGEAIESVLNQSHSNLELIVIDDCTPDKSMEIAKTYTDSRIVFCKNPKNLGLAQTRNTGMRVSKGKYIAMLDSDDIATPDRIGKQVAYLEKHIDVGICGTGYKLFGNNEKTPKQKFIGTEELKTLFAFFPGFHCTTIMLRSSLVFDNNLFYWEDKDWICEDYDICMRGIELSGIHVIQDCLYLYRKHDSQLTTNDIGYKQKTAELSGAYISKKLGNILNDEELKTYIDMASETNLGMTKEYFDLITNICNRLIVTNNSDKVFIKDIFNPGVSLRWYRGCKPYIKNNQISRKELSSNNMYGYLPIFKRIKLTLLIIKNYFIL